MAYVSPDFKSKKALRAALSRGEPVNVFYPGLGGPLDGTISVEGPHYPRPHTWYALVDCERGKVIKVRA